MLHNSTLRSALPSPPALGKHLLGLHCCPLRWQHQALAHPLTLGNMATSHVGPDCPAPTPAGLRAGTEKWATFSLSWLPVIQPCCNYSTSLLWLSTLQLCSSSRAPRSLCLSPRLVDLCARRLQLCTTVLLLYWSAVIDDSRVCVCLPPSVRWKAEQPWSWGWGTSTASGGRLGADPLGIFTSVSPTVSLNLIPTLSALWNNNSVFQAKDEYQDQNNHHILIQMSFAALCELVCSGM